MATKPIDSCLRQLSKDFGVYVRSARQKHIIFMLDLEEFRVLSLQPCFYCGIMQDKGFNGIDRVDQSKGYAIDNCVGCCEQCNFMKGSLDANTFIRRMMHIASRHAGHLDADAMGSSFPELFPNSQAISYAAYRSRALKHKWTFELTEEEYGEITAQPCYLCGKESDDSHRNGVDRVDNAPLYSKTFCRPCCRECNYMKKNTPLSDYLQKVQTIAILWRSDGKVLPETPQQLHSIASLSQKKTKEEWREEKKLRVQHKVERAKAYLSSQGAATEMDTVAEPAAANP